MASGLYLQWYEVHINRLFRELQIVIDLLNEIPKHKNLKQKNMESAQHHSDLAFRAATEAVKILLKAGEVDAIPMHISDGLWDELVIKITPVLKAIHRESKGKLFAIKDMLDLFEGK